MATPTHETTETHCDKISYSWVSRFCLHNSHICHNSIHKSSSRFLDFLLIIFVWCFLFGLVSCALCSSTTTWLCCIDQEVTTQQIVSISILMFTGMLQSYLTFEAINMSIQKPHSRSMHSFYTSLLDADTLSPLLLLTLALTVAIFWLTLWFLN